MTLHDFFDGLNTNLPENETIIENVLRKKLGFFDKHFPRNNKDTKIDFTNALEARKIFIQNKESPTPIKPMENESEEEFYEASSSEEYEDRN